MQHEFRYAGETYDVLLERTPKIWTFANHCAHPREDGRIRIYFEDGSKAWAHVAKVGEYGGFTTQAGSSPWSASKQEQAVMSITEDL